MRTHNSLTLEGRQKLLMPQLKRSRPFETLSMHCKTPSARRVRAELFWRHF
jgi:hypothetical protein